MHVARLLILTLVLLTILHMPAAHSLFSKKFRRIFKPSAHHPANSSALKPRSLAANEEVINIIIRHVDDSTRQRSVVKREIDRPCSDDELMTYLAELQVISPENIVNLATADELPVVCKQVLETIEAMEIYIQTCEMPDEHNLYTQLATGVARFADVMCEKETKVRKAFVEHMDCLRELHDDFDNCFGPADWAEEPKKKDVCCAYKEIADCYYVKAAEVCGMKAAKAMRHLVTTVIDAVLPVHCAFMMKPVVHDPAPNPVSSSAHFLDSNAIVVVVSAGFVVAAYLIIKPYNTCKTQLYPTVKC